MPLKGLLLKGKIRHEIFNKRLLLSEKEVEERSNEIVKKLERFVRDEKYRSFLLYYPFKNEVTVLQVFNAIRSVNKTACFPKVKGKELIPIVVENLKELVPGFKSIPEPAYDPSKICRNIDVAFVPGIAFDLNCCRIGYGGGYYDRFLGNRKIFKVGICFDFQIIENLPCEPFDVRMDMVISEKREIRRI